MQSKINPAYDMLVDSLNSDFSFLLTICLTKANESTLPYCLPIDCWIRGKRDGLIPFPRALAQSEIQKPYLEYKYLKSVENIFSIYFFIIIMKTYFFLSYYDNYKTL